MSKCLVRFYLTIIQIAINNNKKDILCFNLADIPSSSEPCERRHTAAPCTPEEEAAAPSVMIIKYKIFVLSMVCPPPDNLDPRHPRCIALQGHPQPLERAAGHT